eukprot:scaffold258206_cov25-Prasinocladus_malaysianus.AAC.1
MHRSDWVAVVSIRPWNIDAVPVVSKLSDQQHKSTSSNKWSRLFTTIGPVMWHIQCVICPVAYVRCPKLAG